MGMSAQGWLGVQHRTTRRFDLGFGPGTEALQLEHHRLAAVRALGWQVEATQAEGVWRCHFTRPGRPTEVTGAARLADALDLFLGMHP